MLNGKSLVSENTCKIPLYKKYMEYKKEPRYPGLMRYQLRQSTPEIHVVV